MDDWQKVIAFHGHACCILAIGYRAAKLALSLIRETSDEGEQPVALVETVDCSTDAVQVLTGCTFGGRRLKVKETGKYAFTLGYPSTAGAVRVVLKPGVLSRSGEAFLKLMEKVANGEAGVEEKEQFYNQQEYLMQYILNAPAEEIFDTQKVKLSPVPAGFKFQFTCCDNCREEFLSAYAYRVYGKVLCPTCAGML
ncbi:formylmethanofuran dehydrogenase [Desulfallas sp. Bu1-1]|uniref:FmdE family protein n=1 Tax=Desulfallas sp. Bu1-1 TaxID=2787620 RepID=UPI00189E96FD|nr:FmdE family protein [Desulfallas sp. Bu1-1]MBF7084073.1 formylmethanofuran dehydrogenase [Desulfallas sp. Bu1-1]